MKVVVQNLHKIAGLASDLLVDQYDPDVLLAQEINLRTEKAASRHYNIAHNTSRSQGYGTAIFGKNELSNVKLVSSPHAEFGGTIVKKTTVATCDGVQFVSFHGYNGQPFKVVSKLVDHVKAVVKVLDKDGPAIFAGDFNTWSETHVEAVEQELKKVGFKPAYSWPYPDRDVPLDHAFTRQVTLKAASAFRNSSDHFGSVLEVVVENC